MKIAIAAGPATTGKTSVLRHAIRKLIDAGEHVAFLKIERAGFNRPPTATFPA